MNYTWRYYKILSYICFAAALYKGANGDTTGCYELMALALFLELKEDLHQIKQNTKSE